MKSNILSVSISLIAVAFMSGCGSSSSTPTTAATEEAAAAAAVTAAVSEAVASDAYDVSGTNTYTDDSGVKMTSERKISADGAFETFSNPRGDGSVNVGYRLANNVNELVMTQVTTTDIGTFDDSTGKGTVTIVSDLAKGTSHIVGSTDKEGPFDCVQTYDIGDMPKTINSTDNFEQFIYLDGFQKTNTTCPDWIENNTDSTQGENEFVTTTTVTDSTGRVSTIKQYGKESVVK